MTVSKYLACSIIYELLHLILLIRALRVLEKILLHEPTPQGRGVIFGLLLPNEARQAPTTTITFLQLKRSVYSRTRVHLQYIHSALKHIVFRTQQSSSEQQGIQPRQSKELMAGFRAEAVGMRTMDNGLSESINGA